MTTVIHWRFYVNCNIYAPSQARLIEPITGNSSPKYRKYNLNAVNTTDYCYAGGSFVRKSISPIPEEYFNIACNRRRATSTCKRYTAIERNDISCDVRMLDLKLYFSLRNFALHVVTCVNRLLSSYIVTNFVRFPYLSRFLSSLISFLRLRTSLFKMQRYDVNSKQFFE